MAIPRIHELSALGFICRLRTNRGEHHRIKKLTFHVHKMSYNINDSFNQCEYLTWVDIRKWM